MKFIIAVFFPLLIFANIGDVHIKGKIEEVTFDKIALKAINNRPIEEAEVREDGMFSLVAKIKTGFYLLEYGRESTYLYLSPKDNLQLTVSANDFLRTLSFSGEGAERNNYLVKKAIIDRDLGANIKELYDGTEEEFLKKQQQIQAQMLKEMKNFQLEDDFIKAEKVSLDYEYLLGIQNYVRNYNYYLGEETTVPDSFYEPIQEIDLENWELYPIQPYYHYLINSIWSNRIAEAEGFKEMDKIFKQVTDNNLALNLLIGFYSKINNDDLAKSKAYFRLIEKYITHKPFVKSAKEKLEGLSAIQRGDLSPDFTYQNIHGEKVSLKDFMGKYVYIDVWATWCAPCLKQLPYLQELEEEFASKNIVFLSISVDKQSAKSKWIDMVKNKEMKGVQLIADNSFESAFMETFGVNAIPRFILIDPNGKVYDSDAPKPSYDKTKQLLEDLLN